MRKKHQKILRNKTLWVLLVFLALIGIYTKNLREWLFETPAQKISSLRLLSVLELPHQNPAGSLSLGGISGMDWDPDTQMLYLLSDVHDSNDPKKFPRFYTCDLIIERDALKDLQCQTVMIEANPTQKGFEGYDGEAIRLSQDQSHFYWASEGSVKKLIPPFLEITDHQGKFVKRIEMPASMHLDVSSDSGAYDNNAIEGIDWLPDHKTMLLAMETSLMQDGEKSTFDKGAMARFSLVNVDQNVVYKQFVYPVSKIPVKEPQPRGWADNGVSDVLVLNENQALVMERSFVEGQGNAITINVIDWRHATDVKDFKTLQGNTYVPAIVQPVQYHPDQIKHIDNWEAMSWGPVSPEGRATILVMSDDNFNLKQKNQLLWFEVMP